MKLVLWSFPILGLVHSPLAADTVYLKNGAWIDGVVKSRSERSIEIEIGSIGKVEIAAEDIDSVEKNNRTGAESRKASEGSAPEVKILTRNGKKIISTTGAAQDPAPEVGKPSSPTPVEKPEQKGSVTAADEVEDPAVEREITARVEEKKIAPELKARIDSLVQDLQKQKAQFRTRAERHLKAIGQPALPSLLPLAKNDADLTRTAVFRLFHDFGDETVIEACIDALLDTNEYVRGHANKTLERVTTESFGYQPSASPRRREAGYEKWKKWWAAEKAELAEVEKLKG